MNILTTILELWDKIKIKSLEEMLEEECRNLSRLHKTIYRIEKACPALDVKPEIVEKILEDVDKNPNGGIFKYGLLGIGIKEAFEKSPYKVYKVYYSEWLDKKRYNYTFREDKQCNQA